MHLILIVNQFLITLNWITYNNMLASLMYPTDYFSEKKLTHGHISISNA